MMASSSAMPPVRAVREATTPSMEITATSVVEPPMLTTMTPFGSEMDTPAPTAARHRGTDQRRAARAQGLDGFPQGGALHARHAQAHGNDHARAIQRPPATDGLFRKRAQKRRGQVDIAHRAVQHRRNKHRLARRTAQHLPGVAATGEHAVRLVAQRQHIARLAQHHALVLQKNRHIGGAQVDAHAAG